MALVFLVVSGLLTWLLGWLTSGEMNPSDWELWFRTLFVIIWVLWTMRAYGKHLAKKGK